MGTKWAIPSSKLPDKSDSIYTVKRNRNPPPLSEDELRFHFPEASSGVQFGNENWQAYPFTLAGRTIIAKGSNKCWQACTEIRPLVHRWQKCKVVQALWKTAGQLLKRLTIELPRLHNSTPRCVPRRSKHIPPPRSLYTKVPRGIIYNSQKSRSHPNAHQWLHE